MVAMEDKGEIVSFMGHVKENEILKVTESIVFVMDGVRSSPTKKRRLSKARLKMSPPQHISYVSVESFQPRSP